MGIGERYRAIRRAESPVVVKAIISSAPTDSATSDAARQMMPVVVLDFHVNAAIRGSPCASVDDTIRAMMRTVWIGNRPTLVSPDSMTASAPSSTALATSLASARVGRGAE